MNKFFDRMGPDRLILYFIGILVLLAILGYFLASYSWDNIMNILTATEIPSPTPTLTPLPGA
ncbi:MAG: hypothetical protein PVJ21_09940 [Anaerolineales bacterium]|jgi:hypothetical protein